MEKGKVSVDVPRFKELRALVPPDEDEEEEDVDVAEPGTFTRRRKVAVALTGAGIVAMVAGAVLGVGARQLEDDVFGRCPDPATPCPDAAAAQDLLDRARSRALLANVGYGVGAAALVGAAVLWITGAPEQAPPRDGVAVTPRVGLGYSGIDVSWRF